jgi:periplasmic divalent cation tolerance protein
MQSIAASDVHIRAARDDEPNPGQPNPGTIMPSDVLLVLSTFPPGDAAAATARTLVEEKLAACVNLVPGLRSIYAWDDAIQDDAEVLALIKTTADRFEAMRARLLALHPAKVPEVIAVDVADGHLEYLGWVRQSVRLPEGS